MQPFDELKLQRLVDGELERAETREMLKLAEENPLLWRDMASAFVENQMWQGEFSRLDQGAKVKVQSLRRSSGSASNSGIPFWLTMAAGMFVALTAGLLIGRGGLMDSGNSRFASSASNDTPNLIAADETPALDASDRTLVSYPDYHLKLEDANGNSYLDSEIPLYNASNADRAGIKFDQPTNMPREFLERVGRTGYGVKEDINYISGRLDDGRQFYVPVRTISLSPSQ